ncbi:MAG: molybdenum cofactor biosynthesis protein MoaE [Gemmatimonadales bacterium]
MPHLTRNPISPDVLLRAVAAPECGGTCLFLGTVRNAPEHGGVTAIAYSAYDAMAEAELDRIAAEARERWPGCRLGVTHRLGRVPLGEASVAIAAAAPHRADAFAACRYAIEEIKRRLPVWKKEYRLDGSTTWVEPGVSAPDGARVQ